MEEKDRQTLDLEDIIKEFRQDTDDQSDDVELPQEFTDFISPELDQTVVLPSIEEIEKRIHAQAAAISGDTIRLDVLQIDPEKVSGPKEENLEDTRVLELPQEGKEQEAFTSAWEPEYEQPMGEYVPPQPIIFQPRSRLRELKRKLVAGPERRYYVLSEKGVGKLQAAIFLSVLVCLLCIGATAMYAMGAVKPERLRLMIFGQFLALLISALLGSFQMIEGVADLFHKRFSPNTLLVLTFLICCVDGVFCLQQLRIPCCGAFSLQVLMSLWGTYHRRVTEMGQMDTLRKAIRLDGLAVCPDYYQGKKGLVRQEGQVEDFMEHYDAPSRPEKVLSWYCLAATLAVAGVGITAGVFYGLYTGIQAAAVSALAAAPATIFISQTRPMAILERRLHKLGTVICGWRGVQSLCGKAVFPLNSQDLYPVESVRMNGVKFFGSRTPDEIVAYCAAMISADNSGLAPVFNQVLESRNGIHYNPGSLCYYDGGVGGLIDGESVLVGTLSFMKEMDIQVPEGAKVSNAVCIAIEGEFSGLFALSYEKVKDSVAGLSTLCSYRRLNPVITDTDFVLTERFVRSKLGVSTKRICFPEQEERLELEAKQPVQDTPCAVMVTTRGLAPFAYGVTGARALRLASRLGVIVHMVGGILGLGIMLALVLLGAMDLLTPVNVLAYQLVWMIPGVLITEWTRAI